MLAERASLAAAQVARNIHLGAWLGEWEIRRTEAYLGVGTKHLARKIEQCLAQVAIRHVLIHIECLHLVEEAVGASRYCLVAINTSGADDADRRLGNLHHTRLHRRSVGAQQNVGAALYEECILHVACRMVFGKVERREHMPVVFHLRTLGNSEAETSENVDYLLAYKRDGVASAERHIGSRTGEVDTSIGIVLLLKCCLEFIYLVGGEIFQFVKFHTYLPLLVGGNSAEFVKQSRNFALLAQVFDTQSLKRLGGIGL